ncbi:hypothetical protein ES705_28896 [subsurface metagenome]
MTIGIYKLIAIFVPEIQNINKIMTNKEIVSYYALGAGGRRFESCHPDKLKKT